MLVYQPQTKQGRFFNQVLSIARLDEVEPAREEVLEASNWLVGGNECVGNLTEEEVQGVWKWRAFLNRKPVPQRCVGRTAHFTQPLNLRLWRVFRSLWPNAYSGRTVASRLSLCLCIWLPFYVRSKIGYRRVLYCLHWFPHASKPVLVSNWLVTSKNQSRWSALLSYGKYG